MDPLMTAAAAFVDHTSVRLRASLNKVGMYSRAGFISVRGAEYQLYPQDTLEFWPDKE